MNCTAPSLRAEDDPFLAQLVEAGLAAADPMGLGITVTRSGNVAGTDGVAIRWLWAVGPLRKGSEWEATAVPELRRQAQAVSRGITAEASSASLGKAWWRESGVWIRLVRGRETVVMDTRSERPPPAPRRERAEVAVAAPGAGPGYWAGAPSAVAVDGAIYLAYRLRRPLGAGRGYAVVVARSHDGVTFETVAELHKDAVGTDSLERPAIVPRPDGGWRLYVSGATPGTLHWWVDAFDADDLEDLPLGRRHATLPGDTRTAVKDPVVLIQDGTWHLWACIHPLDDPGQADRMLTRYATSSDGLAWTWHGTALAGRVGTWDERGARITSVLVGPTASHAYYDGRANVQENWEERTGLAAGTQP